MSEARTNHETRPDVREGMVFLLGAGASREAGVPLARELTARTLETLPEAVGYHQQQLAQALNYVVSAIVAHRGRNGASPQDLPDIETVVSSVELLRDRDEVELAPFVQSWDPAVGAMDQNRAGQARLSKTILDGIGQGLFGGASSGLTDQLAQFVRAEVGLAPGNTYADLLPALFRVMGELLKVEDSSRLSYLEPLVRLGAASGGLTVATLNYDLTLETTAAKLGVSCSTGVQRWEETGRIEAPEEGLRLLKLHGSIDWTRGGFIGAQHGGPLGISRVTLQTRPPKAQDDLPFLIFGRREKLRPEGPFLDLRAEFARRLNSSQCLVVVGYSFADDHVNELVAHWINADSQRFLVVVDPNFPVSWGRAQVQDFRSSLLSGLRSHLFGKSLVSLESSRLLVIRKGAADALPSLCQAGPDGLKSQLVAELGSPTAGQD